MLPVVLGGVALLLALAAGGSRGSSTRSSVKGSGAPTRVRLGVAPGVSETLLDTARKAKTYVAAHPDQKTSLDALAELAHDKGHDDVARVLQGGA